MANDVHRDCHLFREGMAMGNVAIGAFRRLL